MDSISSYLLRVIAVCLIGAIAIKLIHKGVVGAIVRLVTGIMVALCVISPLIQFRFEDLSSYIESIQVDGESIAAEGENSTREARAQIITERTTAYILDRADALGLELSVTVQLAQEGIPVPTAVMLRGVASAYARTQMIEHISSGLGIDSEEIQWTH